MTYDITVRDEANILTALAFRNGPIEDLHAGSHHSALDDPTVSRITDDEMKAMMINASAKLAELLHLRDTDLEVYGRLIIDNSHLTEGWVRDWPLKDAKSPD